MKVLTVEAQRASSVIVQVNFADNTGLFFSQVYAEALLKTLELMSKLRQQVKDMETSFYRMLQVHTHTHSHTLITSSFAFLSYSLVILPLSVCLDVSGPEDCYSPLSGPDVPPQRACADRTLLVV